MPAAAAAALPAGVQQLRAPGVVAVAAVVERLEARSLVSVLPIGGQEVEEGVTPMNRVASAAQAAQGSLLLDIRLQIPLPMLLASRIRQEHL